MTISDFCEIFLGIPSAEDANQNQNCLNFSSPDLKLENAKELQDCLKYIKDDYKNIKVDFFIYFCDEKLI